MLLPRVMLLAAAALVGAGLAAAAEDAGALCDRLASHPRDPMAAAEGVVLEDIDLAAAEPACRKAAEEHPGQQRYAYLVGRVLHGKSDYEGARDAYETALDGGYPMAAVGLGILYEEALGVPEDYAKAAAYYRRAMDDGADLGTWRLAQLYEFGLGVEQDFAEAARLYRMGVDRNDPFAANALGVLYEYGRGVAKDPAEAERLYRMGSTSTFPDAAADGKNLLAWMWVLARTNLAEAESLAMSAVEAYPEDASYRDTLGWVRFRLGRLEEAAADLEQAVALEDDSAFHDRLGDVYAALGRAADAKAQWQKALDLPPPDPLYEPEWDADAIARKIAGAK